MHQHTPATPSGAESRLPFEAVLTPHRSLSTLAFKVGLAAVGLLILVTATLYVSAGAWPVALFLAVAFAALWIAFRLNYRDGRRYETVSVTRTAVRLTEVDAHGRSRYRDFPTTSVVLRLDEAEDGTTRLVLQDRATEVPIGRFLTDDERRDFARHLDAAILEARGAYRVF